MKVSKFKSVFLLAALLFVSLLAYSTSYGGENPWDGDDPSGGTHVIPNNGGNSDNHVTPNVRSIGPETPVGYNISILIQGKLYRLMNSAISLFIGEPKQSAPIVKTTSTQTTSTSKQSVSVGKLRQ